MKSFGRMRSSKIRTQLTLPDMMTFFWRQVTEA